MSFLAIIFALGLVQLWGSADRLHRDDWFSHWRGRATAWQVPPWLALVVVLAVPVGAAALVLDVVRPLLFGLLWIALATALLLYAFGRGDFHGMMAHYRGQCHSGDFEGAYLTARTRFGWEVAGEEPDSPPEAHAFMQRGFTYEALQRWFAVIFYFALLGPAAALAYRLLQLCREGPAPALVERCLFIADWVPARLLALTFAVTGDFTRSRSPLATALGNPSADAAALLAAVSTAALGPQAGDAGRVPFGEQASEQNRELGALLSRSAVCWVLVLSLLVVLG